MIEDFRIAFGRKLDLPKIIVGTPDGKPLHGREIHDILLKELDIPVEEFKEVKEEYERRYREENQEEVFNNRGHIPSIMWLTYKLPIGLYIAQKKWTLGDCLPENHSLHFDFHEVDDWANGSYLLYATFLEPNTRNWNGSWAKEIPELERCLSYRPSVANMLNKHGFNFQPVDIKFYLNKEVYL